MGAHRRTAKISTDYLADRLGTSQQTASRYLIGLERKGWIKRTITPDVTLLRIDDEGLKQLKTLHQNLQLWMEGAYPTSITLEGAVFTGLGEGAYYTTKEIYRRQFIEKLGFEPYPGTLNLKLTSEYDLETRAELEALPAIEIEGFKDEDRTFGAIKTYPAIVANQIRGALISALRSHYDRSVIEIIAPVNLRKQLKVKDGQKVKVEIQTVIK
jgi:riboflavin kinase